MRYLIITFLLTFSIAHADFTKGRAKFLSRADDSLSLVKKQLVYLATRELINKELEGMGLQSELFWKRYDEELEEEKKLLRENYEEKYGMNSGTPSRKKRLNFEKVYREKSLELEREFGNITQVLESYKVSGVSRSSKNPLLRYINMEGRVNRLLLKNLYFKFFKNNDDSTAISNIYWRTEINLTQGDWEKLGVSSKETILTAINNSLLKKLSTQVDLQIDKILFSDDLIEKKIQSYVARMSKGEAIQDDASDNPEERDSIVDDYEFSRSSHILFTANLDIKEVNKNLGELKLEISHKVSFVNLFHFEPILITNYQSSNLTLKQGEDQNIPSQLASFIHGRFVSYLNPIKSALTELSSSGSYSTIELKNVQSIKDVIEFQDLLRKKGVSLRLDSIIKEMTVDSCQLSLRYVGKEDTLRQILQSLSGSPIENDKIVKVEGDRMPLVVTFK